MTLPSVSALFPRWMSGTITHVQCARPLVALTFDDGPCPATTPQVLRVLHRFGAKATFFVLGQHAARWPAIMRDIACGGHAIGNHSWNHPSIPLLTRRHRHAQIRSTAQLLEGYQATRLFRPPYGHQTWRTRLDALWLRHEVVGWNADPMDYRPDLSATLAERLWTALEPGNIVLLHDHVFELAGGPFSVRADMLEALEAVMERARHAFTFVTVPELLTNGMIVRQPWVDQPGPPEFAALFTYASSHGAAVGPRMQPRIGGA